MRRRHLVLVASAAAVAGFARAAEKYPAKPIRLVLGYTPGGGADAVARQVTDDLAKRLGQPVIVDYMPGAGTTIASTAVAKSAPDGYTLYMSQGGMYGPDQALYKRNVKYDARNFTAICRWSTAPLILVVGAHTGIKSTQDLLARAKAEPQRFTFSSSGVGSPPHLAALHLQTLSRAQLRHIPFKGGSPALQAVAAGEVDLSIATPPSAIPMLQTNRVVALAVSSQQRSSLFPQLPTIAEGGVKGYDFTFWFGLFGPAGLEPEVLQRLFDASRSSLQATEVKARLFASGNEAAPSHSPAEFAAWATADGRKVADLISKSGITLE